MCGIVGYVGMRSAQQVLLYHVVLPLDEFMPKRCFGIAPQGRRPQVVEDSVLQSKPLLGGECAGPLLHERAGVVAVLCQLGCCLAVGV